MLTALFQNQVRGIIKKYGRGYYRATFLFPREIREATWIYYTFIRLVDEIVDSDMVIDREKALGEWVGTWDRILQGDDSMEDDPRTAFKKIIKQYSIPTEYSYSFFDSMRQDLSVARYKTYADLEGYMYGSAVVVGYTMSHIIGFTDGALSYARALGEAFQMINFLRDVHEDYHMRGRIYLPQEDMVRFGVTTKHIAESRVDDAWRALMKFEIQRTRELYETGVSGIRFLHPRGRRAVYAAACIYKEILDAFEANDYDIFSKRIVVSPFRKTMLLWKALWKRNL